MKTPRELLLERHRQMEMKLDAVRQRVLATQRQSPRTLNVNWWSRLVCALTLIHPLSNPALFRPWRPHLAGLVAVWLAIFALKLTTPGVQQPLVAKSTSSSTEQLLALAEKRKLLAELMDQPVESPKPDRPAPRSERRAVLGTG